MKQQISIIEKVKEITIFGLWKKTNDKSVSKDIPDISKKYYEIIGNADRNILPFFVISKEYNEKTRNFMLFVGGFQENSNLEKVILPHGYYAVITIKPKLGFLWGLSIGQAKRYFYKEWLPKSEYRALNMEYEYHTEKSVSKNAEIDIFFLIEKKTYN